MQYARLRPPRRPLPTAPGRPARESWTCHFDGLDDPDIKDVVAITANIARVDGDRRCWIITRRSDHYGMILLEVEQAEMPPKPIPPGRPRPSVILPVAPRRQLPEQVQPALPFPPDPMF